jgi:hypothetical protein
MLFSFFSFIFQFSNPSLISNLLLDPSVFRVFVCFVYFGFWDGVSPCWPGWSWTHKLKWSSQLSLWHTWDYRHIPHARLSFVFNFTYLCCCFCSLNILSSLYFIWKYFQMLFEIMKILFQYKQMDILPGFVYCTDSYLKWFNLCGGGIENWT